MESIVGFSLIPKYVTLNDLSGHITLNSVFYASMLSLKFVVFKDNCVKTNEDRLPLFETQIFSGESNFWRYKVYADIRGSSLEKRRKTTAVVSRFNARLERLFLAFENNYVKTNKERPVLSTTYVA